MKRASMKRTGNKYQYQVDNLYHKFNKIQSIHLISKIVIKIDHINKIMTIQDGLVQLYSIDGVPTLINYLFNVLKLIKYLYILQEFGFPLLSVDLDQSSPWKNFSMAILINHEYRAEGLFNTIYIIYSVFWIQFSLPWLQIRPRIK